MTRRAHASVSARARGLAWASWAIAVGLLVVAALSAWPAPTAQAQGHWTVGLKSGSLLGLGGVTLERANGGNAALLNLGFAEGRQTLLVLGRRYGSPQPDGRAYVDARLGLLRVDSGPGADWVSLFAVGTGYELPRLGVARIALETGLGLQNVQPSFTPLTRAGVFLGATIGVSF